jgi:DNA-binding MarR family transcriptional regulator
MRNRTERNRTDGLRLVPSLHRATHGVGLYLQALRLGVSQGEAHVLAHLETEGASAISALHAAFGHRRSTLTSILDRLVAADLVQREVHATDRRSFLISLTVSGHTLARKIRTALTSLEASVARRVRAADLAGFEAVANALQKAALAGGGKP